MEDGCRADEGEGACFSSPNGPVPTGSEAVPASLPTSRTSGRKGSQASLCDGKDLEERKQLVREKAAESTERMGPQEASLVSPNFLSGKSEVGEEYFQNCKVLLM